GNTLKAHINFKSIKQTGLTILVPVNIEFDVNITLTDVGINVQIPTESIEEGSENFRLMSISVFPYFGSARQNKVPGYFVIPDQIGALVRLNAQYNAQIPEMPFYSHDYAYNATASGTTLSVPIFGVVHQVGEHAFYGEVVEGAENTSLQLQLWNQST